MSTIAQCLESLAFCHLQDEARWPAARAVVQQDIDRFIQEAGPALADQLRALTKLMEEFAQKFPDEADPVLIRSYMRSQMRRIGYEVEREEQRTEGTAGKSEE
jgi:hypothetical protein